MKKIYSIAFSLATLLFAVGCTQEALVEDGGDIVIRLGVDGLDTKAPATGGELTVSSLDVYVFKADETTKLYYQHVSDPSSSLEDGKYVQSTNFAGMSNLTGSDSEKEAIVKAAKVYAIANYTGSLSGSETLAELKALAITDAQYREGGKVKADPVFVMTGESADGNAFASGGTDITVADITLKRVTTKMTVKVNFAASTITTSGTSKLLGDDIATTTTWEPMTGGSNFRVMLQNAVSGATLGGVATTPSVAQTAGQVFSYEQQNMVSDGGSGFVSPAFYTYPVQWTDAGDENAPFIKLVLPWKYTTKTDADKGGTPAGTVIDQNVVERYYKVILPDLKELVANTWYQPTVTLTVKPGEGNEPVLVEPEGMKVQPWGLVGGTDPSADPIPDVAMTDAKFISVPTEISVERGTSSSFEVIASGPLTMEIKNISRTIFVRTPNPTKLSEVGVDMDGGKGGKRKDYIVYEGKDVFEINETDYDYSSWEDDRGFFPLVWVSYSDNGSGGTLSLNHQLSASLNSPDFAVTPYVYEIRLKLNSDNSVFKDVVITQTPAISMENALSKGYVYINAESNRNFYASGVNETVDTDQFVYPTKIHLASNGSAVNSHYKDLGYITSADLHNAAGKCKFRFNFNVVPYDEIHAVTDTRAAITGDYAYVFTSTYSRNAASPYNYIMDHSHLPITHSVTNQYNSIVTVTASTSTVNYVGATTEKKFISPGFMVASSYGATSGNLYYGQALLRCATYQEDGYPAGRWRLPTEAELEFLVAIQTKGIMPDIIIDKTWASSGRYLVPGTGYKKSGRDDRVQSRCVYDTWYWGKDPVVDNETYTVKVTK